MSSARTKQINVRLSDTEAATLMRYAVAHGVTPSDLVRHMIQELERKPQQDLSRLHREILATMARDRAVAKSVVELLNSLPSNSFNGTEVAVALVELEHLGHISRAPSPGRYFFIEPQGMKFIGYS